MNVTSRYVEAVDRFVEKAKSDISVVAVILCGSLAYDTVWEKSDVDITVVVRDQKIETKSYCIDEDNIIINASIVTRSNFVRFYERAVGGMGTHSFYSKGKILYSTDESLTDFFEDMRGMGQTDMELAVMNVLCGLVYYTEKIEKWLKVKKDAVYAKYYVLKAAEAIAFIEVCRRGDKESPTREAILRAKELNPKLMEMFYSEPMAREMNLEEIAGLLADMDSYAKECIPVINGPLEEFMGDGDLKTVTMLSRHFHIDSHSIAHLFEFLTENEVVSKVSETIRITPKGKKLMEEVAYIYNEAK